MFEKIQLLPLFQGLSYKDIQEIFEKVKLNFHQNKEGDALAYRGERCDRLIYILDGSVNAEYSSPDGTYKFVETLDAPALLEPSRLYGLNQKYIRTYRFATDGSTFVITKSTFNTVLLNYHVVRTNMLNMLSTTVQKMSSMLWSTSSNDSIVNRILQFFYMHSTEVKGKKTLKIKMTDLADILGESRLNVSKALNTMQDMNLLKIKRMSIVINDLDLAMRTLE